MGTYLDELKKAYELGMVLDSCGKADQAYDFGVYYDECNTWDGKGGSGNTDKPEPIPSGKTVTFTHSISKANEYNTDDATAFKFEITPSSTLDEDVKKVYTISDAYTVNIVNSSIAVYDETAKTLTVSVPKGTKAKMFSGAVLLLANTAETLTVADVVTNEHENDKNEYKDNPLSLKKHTLSYQIEGVTVLEEKLFEGFDVSAYSGDTERVGYTFSWDKSVTTMPNNDVTIIGTYKINSYTLTYILDGVEYSKKTYQYNSELTQIAEPVKLGYTFSGWDVELPANMPADNLVLKAHFTVNSHTLTFEVVGGNFDGVISVSTVDYGTSITAPSHEEHEGYTFAWIDSIPATMPDSDVTITAEYTINSYKATVLDAEGNTYAEKEIEYNAPVSVDDILAEAGMDIPTKVGHTFSKWSEYETVMPAHDITIEPVFEVNKHTVTYIVDGEEYATYENVAYGTELTVEAEPSKEGYTFSGWSGFTSPMPDEDVTVEGNFTINTHTITFIADGETLYDDTLEYGSEIVAPETDKEGYTFNGWDNEIPATMPDEDLVFEGSYTVNVYKLTYVNSVTDEAISEAEVAFGTALETPEEPSMVGYTFGGWSDETPATMPSHDVTIEALFTVNSHTVTYMDGETVLHEDVYCYGDVTEMIGVPETCIKEGYTATCWDCEVPETMPDEDIVVNVVYEINKHSITYVLDGEEYTKFEDIEYGSEISLFEEEPSKEGYTFSGWSELPATMPDEDLTVNGSFIINEYTITYKDGEDVLFTDTYEFNAEVEAKEIPDTCVKEGYTATGWDIEIPSTMPSHDIEASVVYEINKHSVTYVLDGEEYAKFEDIEYGTEITLIEDEPSKEGYTFSGWSGFTSPMPDEDLMIVGSLIANEYTITYKNGDETLFVDAYDCDAEVTAKDVPAECEKEGYTIIGWSEEIPATMPAHDIEVSVVYEVNKHDVVFIIEDVEVSRETVEYGKPVVAYTPEQMEGYTFSWDKEIPATMPDEDLEFVGTYVPNKHTLSFLIADGYTYVPTITVNLVTSTKEFERTPEGDSEGSRNPLCWTAEDGSKVYTRTESIDPAEDGAYTTTSGNTALTKRTITATGVNKYPIVVERLDETVEYGTEITLPEYEVEDGYEVVWGEYPATMPDRDVTVIGDLKVQTFTLTFTITDVDGNTTTAYTGSVVYGTEVAQFEPSHEEVEGYVFSWDKNIENLTMPLSDMTINGIYKEEVDNDTVYYGCAFDIDSLDASSLAYDNGSFKFEFLSPLAIGEEPEDDDEWEVWEENNKYSYVIYIPANKTYAIKSDGSDITNKFTNEGVVEIDGNSYYKVTRRKVAVADTDRRIRKPHEIVLN